MVDDSHATGFVGPNGRGTHEQAGVMGRVDVLTGTLGKALGGASGGYAERPPRDHRHSCANAPVPTYSPIRCRPPSWPGRSRPSNWSSASRHCARACGRTRGISARGIASSGFTVTPGDHPIIPIMIGDAVLAHRMAARLLDKGIYVVGFAYPVVPKGKARIRVQMSAALAREDLDLALRAFAEVKPSWRPNRLLKMAHLRRWRARVALRRTC